LAVDWVVFADWVVATFVIALVVAVSHSYFRVEERRGARGASPLAQSWTGEFIQVTVPDGDPMLLYGEELLKRGDLEQCVKVAFSTAEELLVQAAATLGIPGEHTTLADLGRRLTEAGMVNLEPGELDLLDAGVGDKREALDGATATRALSAAFYVRNYFMHAPIAKSSDKKPIGADSISST